MDLIEEVKCKHGNFHILSNDQYISNSLKLYGEWSELEVDLYNSLLKKNDNVIEVGSHIGSHSIPLANIISDGKLYCFEPQNLIYNILKKNIKNNAIKNTYAYNYAISDYSNKIKLKNIDFSRYQTFNSGGVNFEDLEQSLNNFQLTNEVSEIEVITLDKFFEKRSNKINFIKIDAEGNEYKIFKGGKNILCQDLPMLFWEYALKDKLGLLEKLKFLEDFNYINFKHVTNLYNNNNFRNNTINIFKRTGSFMILSIFKNNLSHEVDKILEENSLQLITL